MDETHIAPTPERTRRGDLEWIEQKAVRRNGEQVGVEGLTDADGLQVRAYRSIDTLGAMHRRGAITAEMRQVGEDFQVLFRLAALDRLQAADMSRPFVNSTYRSSELPTKVYKARESVWDTVEAVGGMGSTGGSCLWHVLGFGMTLKEWAIEQGWRGKPIHLNAAPMALITVLGMLAKDGQKSA